MTARSSVLLEVQTLGEQGLKYRHRLGRGITDWIGLKAIPAPQLTDSCGSGDWCTAGLIAKAAVGGREGFRRAGARGVQAALRYGQAFAAWNCAFEGARGGMYAVPLNAFKRQVSSLLQGRSDGVNNASVGRVPTQEVACPALPARAGRARPDRTTANGSVARCNDWSSGLAEKSPAVPAIRLTARMPHHPCSLPCGCLLVRKGGVFD